MARFHFQTKGLIFRSRVNLDPVKLIKIKRKSLKLQNCEEVLTR